MLYFVNYEFMFCRNTKSKFYKKKNTPFEQIQDDEEKLDSRRTSVITDTEKIDSRRSSVASSVADKTDSRRSSVADKKLVRSIVKIIFINFCHHCSMNAVCKRLKWATITLFELIL